jgi:hypothetical protein
MQNSNVEVTLGETGGLDYKTLKLDIAARLKNSCGEWALEDFEAIVEKVTLTTLKFPPPRPRR